MARLQVFATIAGGNSFFKGVTLFWQGVTVSCSGGNKQVLLIAVKKPKPCCHSPLFRPVLPFERNRVPMICYGYCCSPFFICLKH